MSKNLKKESRPAVKVEYFKPTVGPDLSRHITSIEQDRYRSRSGIDSEAAEEDDDGDDDPVGKTHFDKLWKGS